MSSSQSSVSDDDQELGALIYNSSRTAQRIRSAAAAEGNRALFGVVVGAQNPPSIREEDPGPEINTMNSIVGQSDFQRTRPQGKKRKNSLQLQANSNYSIPAQKRVRPVCSVDVEGCTNYVANGGVCRRHGATPKTWRGAKEGGTVKKISHEGCINLARKGGLCVRRGASFKKFSHEGYPNQIEKGGVSIRHGAKQTGKTCSHEGCTDQIKNGGVCVRHGAKTKVCSHEGCTNLVKKGGVCTRHVAKQTHKTCSHEGCTNNAVKGGACWRHAY